MIIVYEIDIFEDGLSKATKLGVMFLITLSVTVRKSN